METDKPVWLKFNKITRRVYLKLKDEYEVKFSTGIAEILGFLPDQWYHDRDEAEHKADVSMVSTRCMSTVVFVNLKSLEIIMYLYCAMLAFKEKMVMSL